MGPLKMFYFQVIELSQSSQQKIQSSQSYSILRILHVRADECNKDDPSADIHLTKRSLDL